MDEFGFTDFDKDNEQDILFDDGELETDEDLVEMLSETKRDLDVNGLDQDDFDETDDENDYENL
jgi:hypothetical protein